MYCVCTEFIIGTASSIDVHISLEREQFFSHEKIFLVRSQVGGFTPHELGAPMCVRTAKIFWSRSPTQGSSSKLNDKNIYMWE